MKLKIILTLGLALVTRAYGQDGYIPPTGSSGGGAVSSVFGRTGAVSAASSDYSFALMGGFIQATQLVVTGSLTYTQSNGHLDGPDTNQGRNYSGTLYVPKTTTVAGHALSSNVTLSNSDVGLGNVTNDVQTKATIVPNTAPSSAQMLFGNAGGTAYAPQSMSGDATITSGGVLTNSKVNVVSYGTSTSTNNFPIVTVSNAVTYQAVPNAALANSSMNIAGNSTSLGGSVTQDNITGLASTGIVKRTASNTLGIAAAGTDYVADYTDSIRVGPFQFPSPTAADTLSFYVQQSGMSIAYCAAQRVGGTSDSVYVFRVRSGTSARVLAMATTTRNDFLGAYDTQNQQFNSSLNVGDVLMVTIGSPGGTPKNVAAEVVLTKAR